LELLLLSYQKLIEYLRIQNIDYKYLKEFFFKKYCYCSICSNALFFALRYFSLFKLSFQTGCCISLSFLPCNISHSKQATLFSILLYFSRCFSFALLPRGQIFLLIRFFIFLLYMKPPVAVNKNFSIDSFLDWEGHHWNTGSSCDRLQFLPSVLLLPTHLTRYCWSSFFWYLGLESERFSVQPVT